MKVRKLKLIIWGCLFIIVACKCEGCLESRTPIEIKNKSDFVISFYLPLIGMQEGIYPDTSLTFEKTNVGYATKPGNIAHAGISNISIEDWVHSFPKDTVSIYIFSQDTLNKYTWQEIQQNYSIQQRYDLSLYDFNTLTNEYGIPVIPYPPTEAMKNMRMYPPYGK